MRGSHLICMACGLLLGCYSSHGITGSPDGSVGPDASHDAPLDPGVEPTDAVADDPPTLCGNGTLDPGEECDDGNTESLDGCDADCTYTCVEDADCSLGTVCSIDICDLERHACEHQPISCADDDPCTYDYCEAGCRHRRTGPWYRDADRDCWGSETDMTCGLATMPSGYTPTMGDCCDSDPNVSPHETEFFQTPYDCAGAVAPTFDYNCDGEEEPRWLQVGRCNMGSGASCLIEEGWVGYPPACCEEGRWLTECRRDEETGTCQPAWEIARS